MHELTLSLNDKTKSQLLSEGLNRFCANDREHPAARFYIQDDIRQQRIYEANLLEQEAQARELGNLAMQPTLDLDLDSVAA